MTSTTYSDHYFARRASSPLFEWEATCLAAELSDKRVLEVGCGSGELSRRLVRSGSRTYTTSDVVRQTGGHPDVLCSADALPFPPAHFDIVLSQHVVEHLEEPDRFLREASRVLVPEGKVRFTTPNPAYPNPAIFEDPSHVSLHPIDWWTEALRRCGFRVTRATTYFPYLGHSYLLYTSARLTRATRRGVRRGAVIFVEGSLLS
ncbi:MAG: methyltransferase domain-containing protein [Solirubrobacteraceae bacterium]